MKSLLQHRIVTAISLLVMAGALLFTTSCGPEKHKVDDTTVLPFKDKAELDKLLNLPILPDYTIEEYYTKTDFVYGDQLFVVCCKFLEEVTPDKVKEILGQVDKTHYNGWYTFDLGKEDNMRLFFDLDTTLTADHKRPDFLGDEIHVSVEIPCKKNDSWKEFEVVFRNNRADYNAVVNRDTLSKVMGVEFPPVTEVKRVDETIYFEFDTIPSEEFYQSLENARNWAVTRLDSITIYNYEYTDEKVMITADIFKGDSVFSFYRYKSTVLGNNSLDALIQRLKSQQGKLPKSE